MMTEEKFAHLTEREQATLQALVAKRDGYLAQGHPVAARIMGVAIWLAWQVLRTTHVGDDA